MYYILSCYILAGPNKSDNQDPGVKIKSWFSPRDLSASNTAMEIIPVPTTEAPRIHESPRRDNIHISLTSWHHHRRQDKSRSTRLR